MMGIVNDDDFLTELESLNSDKETTSRNDIENEVEEKRPGIVVDIARGRGHTNEVPSNLRKVIAETAISGNTIKNTAEAFNVSPSSVAAYKNGSTSTSTYHQPDKELARHANGVREKITQRATRRILMALKHIDSDKLAGAKAKDIAGIAKDMSAVVKNLEPKTPTHVINGPNYVFYAPRVKKEDEYEVVDAIAE